MIPVMLLMFVAGIALTQAVSDPKQVTLRWLRLGGLIAVGLAAAALVVNPSFWPAIVLPIAQLLAVQLGRRTPQRLAALLSFILIVVLLCKPQFVPACLIATGLSSGLLGGFLMTMLLGHAYLTAGGEMTQKPFVRLVTLVALLLVLRAVASVAFALLPFFAAESDPQFQSLSATWDVVMITVRYLVGLLVPGVFTYMIWDCVKRRANQSATGILYVAGILVILGEGTALALLKATALPF